MAKRRSTKARVNKLVRELVKLSPDEGIKLRAMQIRDRLLLRMDVVLAKVPGKTVIEKCELIGVSRQSYYYWLRGMSRPNLQQAKTLAMLTGYDADDIRGRTRLSPPRATAASTAAARG